MTNEKDGLDKVLSKHVLLSNGSGIVVNNISKVLNFIGHRLAIIFCWV